MAEIGHFEFGPLAKIADIFQRGLAAKYLQYGPKK